MWLVLLVLVQATAFYDWERLHRCQSVAELTETVADYRENFPCVDCRDHFQALLGTHPFPLELVHTPADVRVWTWFTHNLVNLRLNKTWESYDIMDECPPHGRTPLAP